MTWPAGEPNLHLASIATDGDLATLVFQIERPPIVMTAAVRISRSQYPDTELVTAAHDALSMLFSRLAHDMTEQKG